MEEISAQHFDDQRSSPLRRKQQHQHEQYYIDGNNDVDATTTIDFA